MSDIEARRAARRRKILENSESRLKRITGVESKTTKSELDGINITTSNHEFHVESANFGSISNLLDGNGDKSISEPNILERNIETLFRNPQLSPDEDSVSQISATHSNSPRHIYILLLPVLINVVFAICDIFQIDTRIFYLNKIFLPLIAFEIFDYTFKSNLQFSPSLISSVILLSNTRYSRQLNTFVVYCIRITQDVMMYFFAFLISRLCIRIMFF